MEEELKPCPMCKDTSVDYYYEDDNEVSVLCRQCGFETRYHRKEKSAAREWNALPRRLRWTKEKPTKEGWYWLKEEGRHAVVKMTAGGMISEPYVRHVNEVDGEWAGPIPEPMEAEQ